MKKYRQLIVVCAALLLAGVAFILFASIAANHLAGNTKVLNGMGTYRCVEYCHSTALLDMVSYRKYVYTKVSVKEDSYFHRATQGDLELVREYAKRFSDNFPPLARSKDRKAAYLIEHYDFDPLCLSDGDYVYFQKPVPGTVDKDDPASFLFYYFDTESRTMYCFEYKPAFERKLWSTDIFVPIAEWIFARLIR